MDWLDALLLGLLQGLTEFLPISSSGHLELGKAALNIPEKSLYFTVVVHGATVLSTIVVFHKYIWQLIRGLLAFRWNEETKYIDRILFSMTPVVIIGLFFKEEIESFFGGDNLALVGSMLLVTALLLTSTYLIKPGEKKVSFLSAFIMGIAQAIAVLPGISRSGATISTGLLMKNKREIVAQFSFLMVLIPIIGENILDFSSGKITSGANIDIVPLIIGFAAAFVSGLIACKWMLRIVKKGNLIYFAIYCVIIGTTAIIFSLVN